MTDDTPNQSESLVDGPAVHVDLRQILGHGEGCTYGAHLRVIDGFASDGTELWHCQHCDAGVRSVVTFDRPLFEPDEDRGMWIAAAAAIIAIALLIAAVAVGAWMALK